MQHLFRVIVILLFSAFNTFSQIKVMNLEELESRVKRNNDTTYVVNFWATWCAPCVKELPVFNQVAVASVGQPIQFIYLSLDATSALGKVQSFWNKKKLEGECYLFDGGDPNIWINALEPSWQGSIPATFLFKNGMKLAFKEQVFHNKKELTHFITHHN
jgi:thiol-disulfide isomerase/thioredoxin